MKLVHKFISSLTAIALISSCAAVSAYACSLCNPPTDEIHDMGALPDEPVGNYYTLDELFAMSDEEFLALDEDLPYQLKNLQKEVNEPVWVNSDGTEKYGALTGKMLTLLKESDLGVTYTANVTEAEIEKLLGDTVEYKISSPLLDMNIWDWDEKDYVHYGNSFSVTFPSYKIITTETTKATDVEIMDFLKCLYCVNQVIDVPYFGYTYALGAAPDYDKVLDGDVNLDKKVDSADVEHMKKALSGEFTFTNDQLKIADVNGDGVFNALDVEKLKNDVIYSVPNDVEPTKYGDINGNGTIDVSDVVQINLFLMNAEKYPLTDVQKANADCVKDGVINSADGTILLNYLCDMVDESHLSK